MYRNVFVPVLLWLLCDDRHFILGVTDSKCFSDCECCIDEICGNTQSYSNGCIIGCKDGHRGPRCYELCEDNCKKCPDVSNKCQVCYDQFYLDQNYHCSSCPVNCQTCISNSVCSSCKEGFENREGSVCKYTVCPGNCICDDSNCISCNDGYFDVTRSCSGVCPSRCRTCRSLGECYDCIEGYYNGYNTINGIGIVLNNCTHKCRETCKICSSYDQCNKCQAGKYGTICQYECSVGCIDNSCLQVSGKCKCSLKFIGEKCDECVTGKYGNNCDKTCPFYCKNNECDKVSGNCTQGCVTTDFIGNKCEICAIGRYGEHCNVSCPMNCKDAKCDRISGDCTSGCKNNFDGMKCTDCINGKYGNGCDLDCPENCLNSKCNKLSGNCLQCIGKYAGIKCDSCTSGFYGDKCIQNCSRNCVHSSCHIKSGVCDDGCKENFYGDRCCVKSKNCLNCLSNTECGRCVAGYFGISCSKACSPNCKESCDFETGVCDDCITDYYGSFCNFTCSEHCDFFEDRKSSRCDVSDGVCTFGCKVGHFGTTCNMTCSSYCSGNICEQNLGICTQGCNGQFDDAICSKTQRQKDESNTYPVATVAVLGCILSLSLAVNIVLVALFVRKKIKVYRRKHGWRRREPTYENQLESIGGQVPRTASATDRNNSETVERNVYEGISRVNEQEHEYQHVSYDNGIPSSSHADTDEEFIEN